MPRGQGIVDPTVAAMLRDTSSLCRGLTELIEKCDRCIKQNTEVLRSAGIKPEDVNSPHIYQAEEIKRHAQTILRIADGTHTWTLQEKPKLKPEATT